MVKPIVGRALRAEEKQNFKLKTMLRVLNSN